MPPKKKKKATVNPARGFATTSIASKPKPEQEEPALPSDVIPKADAKAATPAPGVAPDGAKEVHELSPEELEKQLELGELQAFVDKYAEKSKREASRQISRLRTDRRVLRGATDELGIGKIVSPEIVTEILNVAAVELESGSFSVEHDSGPAQRKGNYDTSDAFLARLWSLSKCLQGLNISPERVRQCIHFVLHKSWAGIDISNPKDGLWGLDEAFDWLALMTDGEELQNYEDTSSRPKPKPPGVNAPATTKSVKSSGLNTPVHSDSEFIIAKMVPIAKPPPTPPPAVEEPDVASFEESDPVEVVVESEVSDVSSDLEPDDLVVAYIKTKERLFKHHPGSEKLQRRKKAPKPGTLSAKKQTKKVIALESKMSKIEGDPLFDQYIADGKWELMREDLDKSRPDQPKTNSRRRRRAAQNELHPLMNDMTLDEVKGILDEAATAENIKGADSSELPPKEDDSLLGELFAGLPQAEVDAKTGQTKIVGDNGKGGKVEIRDFGKFTGVTPRKALEDVLRARDPGFRLHYKVVSSTPFSTRSSVMISYQKAQIWEKSLDLPTIRVRTEGEKKIIFTMANVACPDKIQSDAYVSTATLFLVSHASARDEKAYLRIPTAFKEFYSELQEIKKEHVNNEDLASLREVKKLLESEVEKDEDEGVLFTDTFDKRRGKPVDTASRDDIGEETLPVATKFIENRELINLWDQKSSAYSYRQMLTGRMALPVWGFRDQILDTIDREQVVIICGETGCGKSTQVPAYLLEHSLSQGKPCKIYCTEPRRISAISLARRVSEELGERKQDLGTSRSMVGYAIRLESKMTRETKLVYATTGIVMRMLESSNGLGQITHLVLDEVHERSIESDFLLIVLRRLLHQRPELKVVLMSATVDAVKFSHYLNNAPVLTVPGRTFPVTVRYLEDAVEITDYSYDMDEAEIQANSLEPDDVDVTKEEHVDAVKTLQGYSVRTKKTITRFDEYKISYRLILSLLETIAHNDHYISFSNAILIFLPGIAEIRELYDMLGTHQVFGNAQKGGWYLYPLHSTVTSEDQSRVFDVPPPGIRKIVLATNIAETGITIPDITCVIDAGKHKEMRFDERRQLSRLIESFISKANAKQRRGRAGRVQEGLCFHLFTKYRHDNIMIDQQTPEMLRLSLQDLVLRVKICKLGGIEETLADALDPPLPKNVRRSIDALIDVKALTTSESLTALGRQLAKLPLDVHLGKLILFGSIYKCLDVCLTLAALLSSRSPFVAPWEKRTHANAARLSFKRGDSDLLTLWEAYSAWRRICTTAGGSEYTFCRKNYLSPQNLSNIEDLKLQLASVVADSGFLQLQDFEKQQLNRARSSSHRRSFFTPPSAYDLNTQNDLVVNSVVAWSFYPHLLVRDGKGWRNLANSQFVSLHPTSVNKTGNAKYLSYYHILQSTNKFYNAHETSAVEDFAIALFCGEPEFKMYAGVLIIDSNRAKFSLRDWRTMLALRILRARLKEILTLALQSPGAELSPKQERFMEIWRLGFDKVYATMKAKAGVV